MPTVDESPVQVKVYSTYIARLLDGRCDPAVAAEVTAVVAGLEDALQRQARDEVDVELRLTALEERLEAIDAALAGRAG